MILQVTGNWILCVQIEQVHHLHYFKTYLMVIFRLMKKWIILQEAGQIIL